MPGRGEGQTRSHGRAQEALLRLASGCRPGQVLGSCPSLPATKVSAEPGEPGGSGFETEPLPLHPPENGRRRSLQQAGYRPGPPTCAGGPVSLGDLIPRHVW